MAYDKNTRSGVVELETCRALAGTVELNLGQTSAGSTSIDVGVDTVVAESVALLAAAVDF